MKTHLIVTIVIALVVYFIGAKYPALAQKVGLLG